MNTRASDRPRRGQLWILLGIFFVPLIVAFGLYFVGDGWRPPGSTHHGDLIDPAQPLPDGRGLFRFS